MKRQIGVVLLGQSPRPDIVGPLSSALGPTLDVIEVGSFDDVDADDWPTDGDQASAFVSRLRDGREVRIPAHRALPRVQNAIRRLEGMGVAAILVACTGELPDLSAEVRLLLPCEQIPNVLMHRLRGGTAGILVPGQDQVESTYLQYTRHGLKVVVDWLEPYRPDASIARVADRMATSPIDLVFLDCFGYSPSIREELCAAVGKPVESPITLLAGSLTDLAG